MPEPTRWAKGCAAAALVPAPLRRRAVAEAAGFFVGAAPFVRSAACLRLAAGAGVADFERRAGFPALLFPGLHVKK